MSDLFPYCLTETERANVLFGGRRVYDDDPVWDALFARSQDVLEAMAEEALEDIRAGRTEPIEALWAEEHPRVSLPNKAETEPALEEETPATIAPSQWDICSVCDLPTLYCRGH